ncbi:MAG: PAS domain S-box protein [Candidatus Heimdallarchaeota archaeon]
MSTTVEDIARRKQADEQLQKSLRLLQGALEAAADGILVVDRNGKIIFFNQQYVDMWRISDSVLDSRDEKQVISSVLDQLKSPESFLKKVRELQSRPEEDHFLIAEFKDNRIFECHSKPQRSNGERVGRVFNFRDVTKQKQVETILRESEEKFRILAEQSLISIVITKEGRVVFANDAISELYGYSKDEMLSWGAERVAEKIHPDDRELILSQARKRWAGDPDNISQSDFRIITKSGDVKWVSMHSNLVNLTSGPASISSFVDITERKQVEEEREALIAELEAKNTELERFVYTVSHDLKSPLITIEGFLGFLEQDIIKGDAEQMKDDITRISNATTKMSALLDELLELSRIGRRDNPPKWVSLSEIACEATEMVAGRLKKRDVEVEIALDLPVVYGDQPRLREIYENLLDNAAKFMGNQPDPRVEIGVRRNGGEMILYVADNGIGIKPQYQRKVFDLFEKLDLDTMGTGVGLAIVKRIVEIHGGQIWVESEGIGHGTTFCFTIPGKKKPDNEGA